MRGIRFCIVSTLKFFHRTSSSLTSKNFVCDSTVIHAYHSNSRFKSIIDRQEDNFYYDGIDGSTAEAFKDNLDEIKQTTNTFFMNK